MQCTTSWQLVPRARQLEVINQQCAQDVTVIRIKARPEQIGNVRIVIRVDVVQTETEMRGKKRLKARSSFDSPIVSRAIEEIKTIGIVVVVPHLPDLSVCNRLAWQWNFYPTCEHVGVAIKVAPVCKRLLEAVAQVQPPGTV